MNHTGRDFSNCRSCGARILWARTENGKAIPLDAQPREDGTFFALDQGAADKNLLALHVSSPKPAAIEAQRMGLSKRVSHFATCPSAQHHRKAHT
jgi:hypothetical protein